MRGAVGDQAFEEEALAREGHDTRTFFNSCVWGFGFIRAWVYLMFLGMGVGVLSGAPDSVCLAVYVSSSAALTVTLFAGGFVPHVVERVLTRLAGQVASIAATVLGTICAVGASTLADAPSCLAAGRRRGYGRGLGPYSFRIWRNPPQSSACRCGHRDSRGGAYRRRGVLCRVVYPVRRSACGDVGVAGGIGADHDARKPPFSRVPGAGVGGIPARG